MSYLTIKDEVSTEFQEKKSLFIGHAKRVYNEEEAKEFINKIKSVHSEATHNVYAYIIGENMGIQRYTDDGEPQGTAGVPVLDVIKKNEVTNVAIVVTRYFGGILLGKGGLVRAYSKGAAQAIKEAGVVERVKGAAFHIFIEYDLLGKVQYLCGQNQWHIEDTIYTDKVEIIILCTDEMIKAIEKEIVQVTGGKSNFKKDNEGYYFKIENRLFKE
ncbi:thymidylate synthase [Clostridium tetanomorphum]|uniref:YigZ family protein n=1 Tax=Clostridium tetanomorphum TaxID=1553 RepID=UPI0004482DDF|nr:YigZ family protein [Clostridium tetanomorphum]KAJ53669.1 thymidylate synthase [Clostridium tetanomorphum DSM 665]MBP1862391.1 thymidylate synthase [Clostridium tetanomorphum]NRS85769.1 thymidylate synthase [Clostridium tetanomorphum]SQC02503.1 thymidylate synthase [Clostridium tetanomorphum]